VVDVAAAADEHVEPPACAGLVEAAERALGAAALVVVLVVVLVLRSLGAANALAAAVAFLALA
jgi:hypothetical protein